MEIDLIKAGEYEDLSRRIRALQRKGKYCYPKFVEGNLYLLINDEEMEPEDVIYNIKISRQ